MAYVVASQWFTHLNMPAGGAVSSVVIPFTHSRRMTEPRDFEPVASVHDIPDEGVLGVVRSDGGRICLIRSRGRITAVANNCTHQDFEMALGDVLPDGTIQCAWHGARFDCATGAVRQGPATRPLPVYQVRIDDQTVMVGPAINPDSAVSPDSGVSPDSAVSQQAGVSPQSGFSSREHQ